MATITGYTAAKMQEIMDSVIASAEVVDDELIFTTYGGDPINLGSIVGPAGPTGPAGSVSALDLSDAIADEVTDRNAAIAASELDTGKGLVAHTQVGTSQTWSGSANSFVAVTSASMSFTPLASHYYQFLCGAVLLTTDNNGAAFDMHLLTGSDILVKASGFIGEGSRTIGIHGSTIMQTPGGWFGSKTFTLQVRSNIATSCSVKGDVVPTFLSAIDLGTL